MANRKYTPTQVEAIIKGLRPGDTITAHHVSFPQNEGPMTCWTHEAGSLCVGGTVLRYETGTPARAWTGDSPSYILTGTSRDPFKVVADDESGEGA